MALTLFEPFRAVFYTPFYAAHALDAYGAEGVDVQMVTAGAEATIAGLIDGSADVTWGGPMRIQYTLTSSRIAVSSVFARSLPAIPSSSLAGSPGPIFRCGTC